MKNNLAITRGIQGVLFAFPILLLTVKGGMSASFFLLVALSIYLLFAAEKGSIRNDLDRDIILFSLAMSATFISVLLSQLYHMDVSARSFDSASRFLFSIPIFFVLRNVDYKVIGILQYGLPAGAILIWAIIWMTGQTMYAQSYFAIHIHLGDMALMLGFLSILSINWTQKDGHWLVVLKVLGLATGLYVSLVSGARGGWAAIPVFILVWILTSQKFKYSMIVKLSAASVVILLGAVLSYFAVDTVHIRLDYAISDLTFADPDSSLGGRFQLWGAAIQLFMQNPILGVGADGFGLAMDGMLDSGVLTKIAAGLGKGEVHSYYFATLARFGLVGLVSVALLFFIPLWMFYKAMNSRHEFHRVAARMGFTLVLGFMVFCLTVEMFNLKMIATFYGMTLAVLLAAATNRRVGQATD
jgi:O-antigen ligase